MAIIAKFCGFPSWLATLNKLVPDSRTCWKVYEFGQTEFKIWSKSIFFLKVYLCANFKNFTTYAKNSLHSPKNIIFLVRNMDKNSKILIRKPVIKIVQKHLYQKNPVLHKPIIWLNLCRIILARFIKIWLIVQTLIFWPNGFS